MWPQLGYKQGYSEGEDGEGMLNRTLAKKRIAGFSERCGMSRTKFRK